MRTTLVLPEDLAEEVKRRAAREGRGVEAEVLELVRKGLAVHTALPTMPQAALITTDPATGLPVIQSPPDAPIQRMTAVEIQALIDQVQLEEDLERVGLSLRH